MTWTPTRIPDWSDKVFAPRPARPLGAGDGREVLLVLGPQRTASTTALGYIRANFAADHLIAREHGISPRHLDWLERGQVMGLAHFSVKAARLQRLWTALATAGRVRLVLTVREPVSRARSFFLYRNRERLAAFHDPDTGQFSDAEAIAADLDAFCRIEIKRQRAWVEEELTQAFGIDPSALRPGRFVASTQDATVEAAVVRREHVDEDLVAVGTAIGPAEVAPQLVNSIDEFGIGAAAQDFYRQFPVTDDLAAELAAAAGLGQIYAVPAKATHGTRPLPDRADDARSATARAHEADTPGLFTALKPLALKDSSSLKDVALGQRLRFTVPVRQPLVLISQIQRSGGTLLSQLLDGHSELHVHPGELHIGRPDKYRWPDLDLTATPGKIFERVREHIAIRYAREGYHKLSGAEIAANPDHRDMALPFIFSGEIQARVFEQMLPDAPFTQRQALDAYATSYFNAWLDYAGLYRDPEAVSYWVGFVARLLAEPGQVERMFDDYPDGRMIIILRSPESWLASAQSHSEEYADTEAALRLWDDAHRRAMTIVSGRPTTTRLIRFEQLVGDTEGCMRALAKFLGVNFENSMLTPTFNRIPIASNSSFGAGYGIDRSSVDRADHLDAVTRKMVRHRTGDLFRKLGAIADYQTARID